MKSWAPHLCCTVCYSGLSQWLNDKRNRMSSAVPIIWLEQKDHHSGCYFCMTNISGYCKKNKSKTDTKLKAGVFVGPEIRKLIRDPLFRLELMEQEQAAWKPKSRQLCRTCGQLNNSLPAPRLPNVTKDAFLAFASHLISVKYGSRE